MIEKEWVGSADGFFEIATPSSRARNDTESWNQGADHRPPLSLRGGAERRRGNLKNRVAERLLEIATGLTALAMTRTFGSLSLRGGAERRRGNPHHILHDIIPQAVVFLNRMFEKNSLHPR